MSDPVIKTVDLEIDGRHYIFSAPINHPIWSYEPTALLADLKARWEQIQQAQPPASDVSIINP